MKRVFFAIALAAVTFVGCNKDNQPDTDPTDLVSYDGKTEVVLEEGTNFYTVNFKATADWSAMIEENFMGVKAEADSHVSIDKTEGGAGAQSIKISIEDLEEDEAGGRLFALTVTASKDGKFDEFNIVFMMGKVFVVRSMGEGNILGPEGGKVTYKIYTSCKYEVKTYQGADQAFPWAPVTFDEKAGTFTFDVEKNNGYDNRDAYVKFTVAEIQIPEYDDEGNPTGNTVDYVERAYVYQGGLAKVGWETKLPDTFAEVEGGPYTSITSAILDGKLYVCSGKEVYPVDMTTGAFGTPVALPACPRGIANDEAGNVIAWVGGDYGEGATPLSIYKVGKDFALAPIAENLAADDFYGYGLDNLTVSGDITKSAAIAAFSAAGYEKGSYMVFYQITDGKIALDAGKNYTDYVGLPWTSAIWGSKNSVGICATDKVAEGSFFIGYDGNYNLHYNPGTSGANWKEVYVTGSSWAEGYNAAAKMTWNGHKYLAVLGMAYFPNWSMPSYLHLLKVDDPEAPEAVSVFDLGSQGDILCAYTSLTLNIENGALCAYVFDGQQASAAKVVFPALD